MTETTKTVFEKYEVRKTRKQKNAFIDYVKSTAAAEGYDCRVEQGSVGARNIVVGNPDTARVVYTAHYDTCAVLPFPNFITPKCIGIYLLYQVLITVLMLGVPYLLVAGLYLLLEPVSLPDPALVSLILYFVWLGMLIGIMWLIMAGPANKHTANDNTSGVTTLLDIMTALPADLRGEVAFVFFDLEEMGLFGSSGFASKHRNLTKNTLLVNFDCVSDGRTMLFALRKGAKPYAAALAEAFPSSEERPVEILSKGVFYPSDQANFTCGVGVASLKRTRRGLLYMDRIHTKRDTVYEEDNIAYLTEGAVRLADKLCRPETM